MRRCPICKTRLERKTEDDFAPFCSQRCKLIDLGNWLGESYRIPDGAEPAPERGEPRDERERPNRR